MTDLERVILDHSRGNTYVAEHFAEAVCACGHRIFALEVDDTEGAAVRTCASCGLRHPMGDSDEYLEDAELEECACPCGAEAFAITVGVSLYAGSEDVRWLYVGAKCAKCGLAAVYADWKNEFTGYRALLARI